MNSQQDSPASAARATGSQLARQVFLVGQSGSFPPAAMTAETIFRRWTADAAERPAAVVLAAPEGYASLVDHLRRRVVQAGAPTVLDPSALEALTTSLIDAGATLIAGGLGGEAPSTWQPTLFVHLRADSLALQADPCGPILLVTSEVHPNHAEDFVTKLAGPVECLAVDADGALTSSLN